VKDVIIVGAGKAGYLHYNSYAKLKDKGTIYIVDIKGSSKYFENIKIYNSIEQVMEINQLDITNTIVDICVPYKSFKEVIENCLKLGLNNVLVEKPFIIEDNFFDDKENLNISMIQNYLYSPLTIDAKNYIVQNNLNIETVITNFSKNRINDSKSGRAFSNNHSTTIFEIEIPHQVYITNYLLGKTTANKLLYISASDLEIENNCYKNHATGIAILSKDSKTVIHESNMTSDTIYKGITVICENGYVLNLDYILYSGLQVIKNGSLKIYKEGSLIKELLYEKDDNIFKNIEYIYNCFNSNNYNPRSIDIIKDFSREMRMFILSWE